jgi:hypothetical protein
MGAPSNRPRATRVGFTQVPNFCFRDPELKPEHIGVLTFLASHKPGFLFQAKYAQSCLGISEHVWLRIVRVLRAGGYLQTRQAKNEKGHVAGLIVEEINWAGQNPKNSGSGGRPDPKFSGTGKFGVHKKNKEKEYRQGRPRYDVLDEGDDF